MNHLGLCLLAVFGTVPNRYSRHKVSGANTVRKELSEERERSSERKLPYIGDGHPTLNMESVSKKYVNRYYGVDDHPLLQETNGSLDRSTDDMTAKSIRSHSNK